MTAIFDYNTIVSDLQGAISSLPTTMNDMAGYILSSAPGIEFCQLSSSITTSSSPSNFVTLTFDFTLVPAPVSTFTSGLYQLCASTTPPPIPSSIQTFFTSTFIIPENYTTPPEGMDVDQLIYLACNGFNGEVGNQQNSTLSQLQYTFPECCCVIQFFQYNQSSGGVNLVGRGCSSGGGTFPLLSSSTNVYDISSSSPPSFSFDFAVLFTFAFGGGNPVLTLISSNFFTAVTGVTSFAGPAGTSTFPNNNLITTGVASIQVGYLSFYSIIQEGFMSSSASLSVQLEQTVLNDGTLGCFAFSTGNGYYSGIANTNGYTSPSNGGSYNYDGTLLAGFFWVGSQYNVNLLLECYYGSEVSTSNGSGSVYTIPINVNNQTAEIIGLGLIIQSSSSQQQTLVDGISPSNSSGVIASIGGGEYSIGGNLNFTITLSGNLFSLFTTYISGRSSVGEITYAVFPSELEIPFSYPSNSSLSGDWLLRVSNPIPFGGTTTISSSTPVSIQFSATYFSMKFFKFNLTSSPVSIDQVGIATIGTGITPSEFDISSSEGILSSSFPDFDFAIMISYQNSSSLQISIFSQGVFNLSTTSMNEEIVNHILQTTPAIFTSQYWNGTESVALSPSKTSSTFVISNGSGGYITTNLSSGETSSPNFIFTTTTFQNNYITSNSAVPSNVNNYSLMLVSPVSSAFQNAFLENPTGELNYTFF